MMDDPIIIWPDGAPDALYAENADIPTLTPVTPKSEKNVSHSAMILCPGDDYATLDMDKCRQTAEWFAERGTASFLLEYRAAPHYHLPAPLMDLQRAIKIVRSRAAEFGVAGNRVGVMGFGAGGHMAACAGTLFDTGDRDSNIPLERWSSRPDVLVLIYPLISMREYVNVETLNNLLGQGAKRKMGASADDALDDLLESLGMTRSADETLDGLLESMGMAHNASKSSAPKKTEQKNPAQEALLDFLSPHLHVNSNTPPTFIVHAVNDSVVSCEHSLLFAKALRAARVPMELHLYEEGAHGFGLGARHSNLATWTDLCAKWLGLRDFVLDPDDAEPDSGA